MKRTREEVADTIEAFVSGTGRQWDWDGFTSIRLDDPELESIRQMRLTSGRVPAFDDDGVLQRSWPSSHARLGQGFAFNVLTTRSAVSALS